MIRVLHVGDLGLKQYGALPNTFERKIFYGLLRNEYCAWEFSDKDVAKFEAPLGISRLGIRAVNRRLMQTVDNFRPDLVLFSNSRKIPNETIERIRERFSDVRIGCYTCDPLFSEDNRAHQEQRVKVADALFVTMAGPLLESLAGRRARVHYIPNPCDPSVECLDNFAREDLPIDLLFCGTGSGAEARTRFIASLKEALGDVRFEVHGILGQPRIRGREYFEVLGRTRMALNLNKQEAPLYSSDRISQLMGNGILCFIHRDSGLERFFPDGERACFFSDREELIERVHVLARDDAMRRRIACQGAAWYREHFSARQVARFMVEATLGLPFSEPYAWPTEAFSSA